VDNPETQSALGTIHRTKTNKITNTTYKTKTEKDEQHGPYKQTVKGGTNPCVRER
jgi:hypothetical protein